MKYQRLFTFGCSYTSYNWPTWADILGVEFNMFYNWGLAGLGNKAISERIAECDTHFNFTENDLVIVQWSSYYRHDWMHTTMPFDETPSRWRTRGSIFSTESQKVFDNAWVSRFWDEKAYYLHTLNHILLTQGFLNSKGCHWYMTSMNDLSKVGNEISAKTIGGEWHNNNSSLFVPWEQDQTLLNYKLKIWDQYADRWLDPIMNLQIETPDLAWWFEVDQNCKIEKNYTTAGGRWEEMHPSIDQHSVYTSYIKDKLFNNPKLYKEQLELVDQFRKIKHSSTTWKDFESRISQTVWAKTHGVLGY